MRTFPLLLVALVLLGVTACSDDTTVDIPQPQTLTREAIGYFCGMIIADHAGPKGQVILQGKTEALWFSSVRDTLAFTRLPEETDPVSAIYVTDMSRAPNWEKPGNDAWIDIHDAVYVTGSSQRGGMGAPEVVPFSGRGDAEAFAAEFGGAVLTLDEVPDEALLGAWDNEDGEAQ